MAIVNPDPLRYPGAGSTTGGTSAPMGAEPASASAWLQQQPWYRTTLASWGNPQTLSLGQRGYLARTAQQAGLNPDFGVSTTGQVEDWSTPLGSKIALAAFMAAAGASALGLGGGGGGGGGSALAGDEAATGGFAPLSAPSVAAGGKVGVGSALAGIGKNVASNTAKNAVSNATGGGNKTAEVLTLLAGLLGGRAFAQAGASNNVPPQLSQLLDIGTQRAAAQQPTFNAVNQGIFSMLPTTATHGIAPPTPSNITYTPQSAGSGGGADGGIPDWLKYAIGGAGGVGLGGLLTGTNPYGDLISGLKKLFGGSGSDVPGGIPIPGEEFDPTKVYGS